MKKAIIISLVLCGTLAEAFGQGTIILDNGATGMPALTIVPTGPVGPSGPEQFYSGIFGMEVYILNSLTLPSNINPYNGSRPETGFFNMLADGYILEQSFTGQTITAQNAGSFGLGSVLLPDINPAGSTECIALAAWAGSGSSFFSPVNYGWGVITFMNPTGNPNAAPPGLPASLTGWKALGQDLVLANPDPEPSMFALAGMGTSALILFRRRRLARK